MTDDVKIIGRLPGFYGWYALAGTMIAAFISGGALINAFGVLLPVICEKFHWGRAVVAGILSVGMISFGLPSPIYGLLVNRLGPKSCIILGNFLAATTMSFLAVSGIIGSIVFGTLAMRFNIRYLASVALLFHFIGLLILLTTEEMAFIYFYTFIMGLGNGSLSAAMPTFFGTYYPRRYYSRIIGFVLPFYLVGQSIAAATVGAIYDFSHSYRLAFSLLIVCALMGMICAFMSRKPEWIK